MPDGRKTYTVTSRQIVCFALIIYCIGIIMLALLPFSTVVVPEIVMASLGGLTIFILVAHATTHVQVPGEKYAYLLTGFLGLVSALAYGFNSPEADYVKIRVCFLLVCGVIGSYGAHLAQEEDEEQVHL